MTRTKEGPFQIGILESKFQFSELIYDFRIDRTGKRIYVLTKTGLIYKNYEYINEIRGYNPVFMVYNINIKGFILDQKNNYIYYFTKSAIYLIDTQTKFNKRILVSDCIINTLNMDEFYK